MMPRENTEKRTNLVVFWQQMMHHLDLFAFYCFDEKRPVTRVKELRSTATCGLADLRGFLKGPLEKRENNSNDKRRHYSLIFEKVLKDALQAVFSERLGSLAVRT